MDVQTAFRLKSPTESCNVILMSSRSLNEILIKIPTELFNFMFAAYNLRFTVSCLFTFVRERMYVEFNSVTLFTVLYSRFLNCTKDVSKVTAHPTILEYEIKYAN